ncbi:bifunctional hydroxymethylpyrimidine kinase/phosphomethylpyrimidine kinase [Natranaerobius thermophilus]|uniref:Hydroxymethylpyrimidine/phosphomethylpyrimidine kinase n=1 Tax=Natranaerobius thermophilus (strain ATCC BAA-1301 / DSM 18059 / JW/NM-WN-LF) TaxID=457570 RepID=B2A1A9_NATTJ|nr:bifunctional hydroxymethylpyrimidine kinase/phosphomethylpyrimidine kinase [Natranaerobius thermophilus]ACB86047.1 phosphomethylpyrimidine kinase [Natranaerobius thermophilus JW/NM-WN-LF]
MSKTKVVMTIAGSDSGGGAGIQADLKTFQSIGVFGTTVLTGVTAQNTAGVQNAVHLESSLVAEQFKSVAEDMEISAVKTGMLSNAQIIETVSDNLASFSTKPWIVIDPVLAATSGDLLLERQAVSTLLEKLIPISDIITPNIPEAEILTGINIDHSKDLQKAAHKLKEAGAKSVLIKGGHTSGNATDHFFWEDEYHTFSAERVGVGSLHGTGCTLGSAICAYLSKTDDLLTSIKLAKKYVTQAINNSFTIGEGSKVLLHSSIGDEEVQEKEELNA